MKQWSETMRDSLRALQYWRRIIDGVAVATVLVVGLGVILWLFRAG